MDRLHQILPTLDYDICVLTGDYRGQTFGPYQGALDGMAGLRKQLKQPVYGVLGNHDTIRMVPALEDMGIRMLLNEGVALTRNSDRIHVSGIDDAHFYRADNLERARGDIPADQFSILLSHTPEIYQQAAHAEFDLLLSGHTHGGQICLPGQIPLSLDSVLPRASGQVPGGTMICRATRPLVQGARLCWPGLTAPQRSPSTICAQPHRSS
jgi:uncharacterized protein